MSDNELHLNVEYIKKRLDLIKIIASSAVFLIGIAATAGVMWATRNNEPLQNNAKLERMVERYHLTDSLNNERRYEKLNDKIDNNSAETKTELKNIQERIKSFRLANGYATQVYPDPNNRSGMPNIIAHIRP